MSTSRYPHGNNYSPTFSAHSSPSEQTLSGKLPYLTLVTQRAEAQDSLSAQGEDGSNIDSESDASESEREASPESSDLEPAITDEEAQDSLSAEGKYGSTIDSEGSDSSSVSEREASAESSDLAQAIADAGPIIAPDHIDGGTHGMPSPEGVQAIVDQLANVPVHPSDMHSCDICLEPTASPLVLAPCGHAIDHDCMVALVDAAIKNEPLFPPRCCQMPIPSEMFIPLLPLDMTTLFDQKCREYGTQKRLYCFELSCSAFLGEKMGEPAAVVCGVCTARTCGACGAAAHVRWHEGCMGDVGPDETQLMEMGKANGWQRCIGCQRIVERTDGCPHMKCLCGAEFCYLCGVVYGTCGGH